MTDWKAHVCRVGTFSDVLDNPPDKPQSYRKHIEPWLSAVFQSEHLSLLVGNGLVSATCSVAGTKNISMELVGFDCPLEEEVNSRAKESAKQADRGLPNFEDQIRVALALASGLRVMKDSRADQWDRAINSALGAFLASVLDCEAQLRVAFDSGKELGHRAKHLLSSFLLSFASRTATRERLSLFTTNYDRLLEHACDILGIRTLDRFTGALSPEFRSSRLDIDLHYNPPGIRGEPRFLEGVVKYTKLHGSVDWYIDGITLRRGNIPFGAGREYPRLPAKPLHAVMVYPNPAKDIETSQYPYSELFRDFSAAICRPNSSLVTYGYGFGDDHINRVIQDALTIPSTHLVVISFDQAAGRIPRFCDRIGRTPQISLLVGNHFGDLTTLVENYLPKAAIDHVTARKTEILKRRGELPRAEEGSNSRTGESQ